MNRIIICGVCILLGISSARSQTLLEKINSIKQSDLYLWDEYTHPVADSAIAKGSSWLLNQVNDGQKGPMTLSDIGPYIKSIKMNRGSLTRAFVYIKKSDVPVLYGNVHQQISQDDFSDAINAEVSTTSGAQDVFELNDKVDFKEEKQFVPDIFVQRVLQQKNFTNVYKFLAEEKKQGQILQFGALKEVDDYSSLDLILFDLNSHEVITLLSPVTQQNKRVNQVSGMTDSLDNYPEEMVAVIWYIKN